MRVWRVYVLTSSPDLYQWLGLLIRPFKFVREVHSDSAASIETPPPQDVPQGRSIRRRRGEGRDQVLQVVRGISPYNILEGHMSAELNTAGSVGLGAE